MFGGFFMKEIKCKDTGEKFKLYKEYLKSRHWKEFKKNFPKNRKCISCGSTVNLHLHHHTYLNIGNENINELDWLCEACHRITHQLKPKKENKSNKTKAKKKLNKKSKRLKQSKTIKDFGLQEKKSIDSASSGSLIYDISTLSKKQNKTDFENKVLNYSILILNNRTKNCI